MTHTLKTWPGAFTAILSGGKSYEIRVNDRDYKVGDKLHLREYDAKADSYSGREIEVQVMHMTHGGEWGLPEGLCVMAIKWKRWVRFG